MQEPDGIFSRFSRKISLQQSKVKKPRRVHGPQAVNQVQSVFCGGVYVAKNTLRGESVFRRAAWPSARAVRSEISICIGFFAAACRVKKSFCVECVCSFGLRALRNARFGAKSLLVEKGRCPFSTKLFYRISRSFLARVISWQPSSCSTTTSSMRTPKRPGR